MPPLAFAPDSDGSSSEASAAAPIPVAELLKNCRRVSNAATALALSAGNDFIEIEDGLTHDGQSREGNGIEIATAW